MYPVYPYLGWEFEWKRVPVAFPPQHQDRRPGIESEMFPRPIYNNPWYTGSGKLMNRTALITGGDSGIGRAVSVSFAKEMADVSIVYLNERSDALETKAAVESLGRRCLTIEGDIRDENFCKKAVKETVNALGRLDILINNAGTVFLQDSILDITSVQLEDTFRTNIFSYFYMTKAALPFLGSGSSIVNTASLAAYEGEKNMIDYSASKGAVVSFTRALSKSLIAQDIRVNAVAPGFVWTPLIPSNFSADMVKSLGVDTAMKRPAQPFELAPTYVYLASDDSRYVTGQTIHVNGGEMVTT